jgi:hypothetical protein
MKKNMKSGKMLKKADALKGFLNSMGKKKGEMGMGTSATPIVQKTNYKQSKSLGVPMGTKYSTTVEKPKVRQTLGEYTTPPRSQAEASRYQQLKSSSIKTSKPSMKKGGLKTVDAEKNPGLAKLPTAVRNKMGYMKKGGMSKMANEGFKNAKRTITDGYKGTGAPNPLAAIVKNTGNKSKMGKKPKMQIGGAFNKGLPAAIATEGKNFEKKESFQVGGSKKAGDSKVNQYNFIQWEREQARKNKPKPKVTPGKPLVLKGKPNPPVNLPLTKGKKPKIVNF